MNNKPRLITYILTALFLIFLFVSIFTNHQPENVISETVDPTVLALEEYQTKMTQDIITTLDEESGVLSITNTAYDFSLRISKTLNSDLRYNIEQSRSKEGEVSANWIAVPLNEVHIDTLQELLTVEVYNRTVHEEWEDIVDTSSITSSERYTTSHNIKGQLFTEPQDCLRYDCSNMENITFISDELDNKGGSFRLLVTLDGSLKSASDTGKLKLISILDSLVVKN